MYSSYIHPHVSIPSIYLFMYTCIHPSLYLSIHLFTHSITIYIVNLEMFKKKCPIVATKFNPMVRTVEFDENDANDDDSDDDDSDYASCY